MNLRILWRSENVVATRAATRCCKTQICAVRYLSFKNCKDLPSSIVCGSHDYTCTRSVQRIISHRKLFRSSGDADLCILCVYIYICKSMEQIPYIKQANYVYIYIHKHMHARTHIKIIRTYLAWYKHKKVLTFFPKHLQCTPFNITLKSAQGSVLLWNPNELTESYRCPLSRTIRTTSQSASSHLPNTAFHIILQSDVTKKNPLCLWYSRLVSMVHFCPFSLFQSDTHSNCQL